MFPNFQPEVHQNQITSRYKIKWEGRIEEWAEQRLEKRKLRAGIQADRLGQGDQQKQGAKPALIWY